MDEVPEWAKLTPGDRNQITGGSGRFSRKGHERTFCGVGNVLYLGGMGYTNVCICHTDPITI